jgi:PAS domain S-box-containing protein
MKKILIIEDDRILLETASDFLNEEGFEVLKALDGLAGIETAQNQLPDLILCDIYMPGFDGYQVHAKLQLNISTAMIPFIFMTAKAGKEDIRFGMDLGVDDYITKPIHFKELLNSIKTRLDKFDKTIRKSELRYHTLFELAKDAILVLRMPEGTILDSNMAGLALLGYSRAELISMTIRDIASPESVEMTFQQLQTGEKTVSFHFVETEWRDNAGNMIPVQLSGTPIEFNNETVYIISARDISEIREKEKALRDSEERYRDLVENTGEGLGVVDPEENFRYANPAACEIFGMPSDQLIGKSLITFLDDKAIEEIQHQTRKRSKGEKSFYEICVNRPDGTKRWIIVTATPQYDVQGRFSGTFGIFRDITESRKAQEKLKESEKRYREISDLTNDWIWEINPEWKYVNVSPKIKEILGYTPEEMIGKTPFDFIIPEDVIRVKEDLRALVHQLQPLNAMVTRATHKNGQVIYLESSGVPIIGNGGEYRGYRGADRDVTLRKLYERELIIAKERAEESDRLKSSILANMSHELRTPLNGILGFAEILKEELKDTDYENMAENIHLSGRRLMTTLNSIITLSQLEAGKMALSLSGIKISESIHNVVRNLNSFASERSISIRTNAVKPISVVTDDHLFKQLFRQILDNAIKFSEDGTVTIETSVLTADHAEWLTVRVTDTGIGISKEYFDLIFQEFRQVSEGFGRKYQGSGIGLTISKKIIDLLGGKITVESEPGHGSTFIIWLPFQGAPTTLHPESSGLIPGEVIHKKEKAAARALPRVLLVEDNIVNKELTEHFLRKDYKVDFAADGLTAIAMAKDQSYVIILMDINLGYGMNGIETTRELRKIPGYENTPVIAVTGYTMPDDKDHLLSEGCTHYIAKPFDQAAILAIMEEALSG